MSNGWTPERKARQAALIQFWKPWERATGPRTAKGKARAARNAWKGGHWLMLRELRRQVNTEIREARKLVELCRGQSAG